MWSWRRVGWFTRRVWSVCCAVVLFLLLCSAVWKIAKTATMVHWMKCCLHPNYGWWGTPKSRTRCGVLIAVTFVQRSSSFMEVLAGRFMLRITLDCCCNVFILCTHTNFTWNLFLFFFFLSFFLSYSLLWYHRYYSAIRLSYLLKDGLCVPAICEI